MRHLLLTLLLLGFVAGAARAGVEVTLPGQPPLVIDEVYWRDGVAYVAVEDLLKPAGLTGSWDSVAHVYRIKAPAATVLLYPERRQVRVGERFIPLDQPPHFIDGRLRVPADFAAGPLAAALGEAVQARSLDAPPAGAAAKAEETGLDRLFNLLLVKKESEKGLALRGVALDPGHGGQDPGALGLGGSKEKVVALEVARRLEKQLKMKLAVPVYLTRDGDYSLGAEQRLQAAARPEVDALVLLHAEASFSAEPRGVVLLVRPREESAQGALPAGQGGSIRLAQHLGAALRAAGFEVAGIIQAPLLPLGRGDLPTVLVELGYLTHAADRAVLTDPAGQEKLAAALFEGLKQFGESWKEEVAK
jgi:N-acetylmuramoyl-L-alanine amidase